MSGKPKLTEAQRKVLLARYVALLIDLAARVDEPGRYDRIERCLAALEAP